MPQHEAQIRALQSRKGPVNVLSTNSAWLLSSLVLGCNGLAVGQRQRDRRSAGKLFRAVAANDLAEARRLNDRIHPLDGVFYADPFVDMHNRMKEALVLLGRLPRAVVRPPLVKIREARSRASARRWSQQACSMSPESGAKRREEITCACA